MRQFRVLFAVLALALVACAPAGADPPSSLSPPARPPSVPFSPVVPGAAAAAAGQMQARDAADLEAWVAGVEQAQAEQATVVAAARQRATSRQQQPRSSSPAPPAAGYEGSATGSVNGYPCGGDLPPCYVLKRESGGNPAAHNPSSSASGLWQFLDTTWAGFGGYARAMDAPASVQNEKARIVWAGGAGCSNWSAC